jgi:hypothetical protein
MAGPGGVESGRARLVVLPDLSKFGASLKKYVERVERQVVIRIPTELDTSGLTAEIKQLQRRVAKTPAELPVEPGRLDAFAERIKREVAQISKSTEVDIPATADGERFRRDLQEMVKGVATLVQVDVPLDVENAAAFRAQVLAQVEEVKALAKRNPGVVPVEAEPVAGFATRLRALIAEQQARMPKLKAKVDVDRGAMSALTTITGQLQTTFASIGAAAATWGPAILAAGAAAVTVAPSIATMTPAAVGAGLAIGTLTLGLHGLSDAIADSSDPKKFAKDMKGLTASQRDVVRSVLSMKGQFNDLRTAVSDSLLKGIGPAVKQVGGALLPVLKTNMVAVAGAFNSGAKEFANFVSKGGGLALIQQNLAASRDALSPLGALLKPLTTAFLQIGVAAAPALKVLSSSIASAGVSFAAFIDKAAKSGQLKSTILAAVQAVISLVSGINAVLKPLAGGLAAVGPSVIGGLSTAFQAVGQVIGALVANAPKLAPVFQAVATAVAPLVSAFAGLGGAYQTYAKQVFTSLASLGPIVVRVLGIFSSALAPVINGVKAFLAAIGPQLGPTIQALGGFISSLLPTIQQFAQAFGEKLGQGLADVGAIISQDVLPAVQRILPVLQPVANFLLHVLGDAILGALSGVINVVKGVLKVFAGLLDFITGVFTGNWSLAWDGIKKIFSGLWDAIKGIVQVAWNVGVLGLLKKGVIGIKAIFTALPGVLKSLGKLALDGLKTGAELGWRAGLTFIQSIPGLIVKGLGKLGELLLSAGRDIVNGLVNGIKGAAHWVADEAAKLANLIPGPIRKILGIASPSKVMIEIGRFVGEGLMKGLTGSADQVQSAAQDLAQKVADAISQLADKRSSLAEKIGADTAAVTKAQADYKAAVINQGRAGAQAIATAALRLKQAKAKFERDEAKKASKGKAGVLATDKAAIARAQLAYKQALAQQGAAAAKAIAAARQKLVNAVAKLNADQGDMRELDASFLGLAKGAAQERIQQLVDASNAQLTDLANRREELAGRLKDAQDQLTQALQVRDSYAQNLRDAVIAFGDVTKAQANAAGKITATNIVKSLRKQLAAVVAYRKNVELLRSGGLSDAALQQILAAGVEGGSATAAGILSGGREAIDAVNSLTADIAQNASQLGTESSRWFYQAGVDSAQSLVDGLTAQQAALDAQAQQVASALIDQIKQVLGIVVDSNGNVTGAAKTTYDIGQKIGQGLADGINSSRSLVEQAAARLASAAAGASSNFTSSLFGGSGGGALNRGTVNQTIVVNNPTKEAASTSMTRAARQLALYSAW